MPGDVLVPEDGAEEAGELVLRLHEAAGGRDHGGRQRARHPRTRQQLRHVGRQAERHRAVCVQLTCNVRPT